MDDVKVSLDGKLLWIDWWFYEKNKSELVWIFSKHPTIRGETERAVQVMNELGDVFWIPKSLVKWSQTK